MIDKHFAKCQCDTCGLKHVLALFATEQFWLTRFREVQFGRTPESVAAEWSAFAKKSIRVREPVQKGTETK